MYLAATMLLDQYSEMLSLFRSCFYNFAMKNSVGGIAAVEAENILVFHGKKTSRTLYSGAGISNLFVWEFNFTVEKGLDMKFL